MFKKECGCFIGSGKVQVDWVLRLNLIGKLNRGGEVIDRYERLSRGGEVK